MDFYFQIECKMNNPGGVSPWLWSKSRSLHVLSLSFPAGLMYLSASRVRTVSRGSTSLQSRPLSPTSNSMWPLFPHWSSCPAPSSLTDLCSRRRSVCSSCHTATGSDYYVVMQADTEAPHLNAKNRTCVSVCLGGIQTWQSRLLSEAQQGPHHSNACCMPQL